MSVARTGARAARAPARARPARRRARRAARRRHIADARASPRRRGRFAAALASSPRARAPRRARRASPRARAPTAAAPRVDARRRPRRRAVRDVRRDGSPTPLPAARASSARSTAADERVLDARRGPVLDVGCGPGRHVLALARRGVLGARHRHLAGRRRASRASAARPRWRRRCSIAIPGAGTLGHARCCSTATSASAAARARCCGGSRALLRPPAGARRARRAGHARRGRTRVRLEMRRRRQRLVRVGARGRRPTRALAPRRAAPACQGHSRVARAVVDRTRAAGSRGPSTLRGGARHARRAVPRGRVHEPPARRAHRRAARDRARRQLPHLLPDRARLASRAAPARRRVPSMPARPAVALPRHAGPARRDRDRRRSRCCSRSCGRSSRSCSVAAGRRTSRTRSSGSASCRSSPARSSCSARGSRTSPTGTRGASASRWRTTGRRGS